MEALRVEDLWVRYYTASGIVSAVSAVSFNMERGEILGVVGESGSGKSTLGRITLRLYKPVAGKVVFDGQNITGLSERRLRPLRRRMQLIPQDPYGVVNPVQTVGEALSEPLIVHYGLKQHEAIEQVKSMLESVVLTPAEDFVNRRPFNLSCRERS
jgi:peptide/nickel transport system ATP-binding protein